jgi:hypothetical protein
MLAFHLPCWNVCGNLTWRLVAKKLHIVACELQVSIAIGKPNCKFSCKTLYFLIVIGLVSLQKEHSPHKN